VPGALATLREHRPFLLFELHNTGYLSPFASAGAHHAALLRHRLSRVHCQDHRNRTYSGLRLIEPDDPVIDRDHTEFFLLF